MQLTPEARARYADALSAQGPEWRKAAASVRSGYTNAWILAGIAGIDHALRTGPDDADETA